MSAKISISVPVPGKGFKTTCDVHVFLNYGRDFIPNLFIITERDDNEGMSVTNASEYIASYLVRNHIKEDFIADNCVFIEHYPTTEKRQAPETWDRVTYTWMGSLAANPAWVRLNPEFIHQIIDRMHEDDISRDLNTIVDNLMPEDNP